MGCCLNIRISRYDYVYHPIALNMKPLNGTKVKSRVVRRLVNKEINIDKAHKHAIMCQNWACTETMLAESARYWPGTGN